MDDCIFCQIVSGEIPSYTIHETDEIIAFLDKDPLAPGHTLVIPKAHHERLQEYSESDTTALWQGVHELIPAIESAVNADATIVGVNNGAEAGQEIPHAHVHIIPRMGGGQGHPIHAVGGPPVALANEELAAMAEDIAAEI